MRLLETSVWSGIGTLIKLLCMFTANKVIAIFLGPQGYTALGQFQNIINISSSIAGGSISNGIIKYSSECNEEPVLLRSLWWTSSVIVFVGSFFVSLVLVIFSEDLATELFGDSALDNQVKILAICVIFITANLCISAFFNGLRKVKIVTLLTILMSVGSLCALSAGIVLFGLKGALTSLATYHIFHFVLAFSFLYRQRWFDKGVFRSSLDYCLVKKLLKFSVLAGTSAITLAVTHTAIRGMLASQFGFSMAGSWDGMMRLSSSYMLGFSSIFSLYFFPKFAALNKPADIKQEIINGLKLIMPVAALAFLMFYVARNFIIELLFTEEFRPMEGLFMGYLIGDFFKIASWAFGFLMLAKGLIKTYIVTEIGSSILLISLTKISIEKLGFDGVSLAYCISLLIYALIVRELVWRKHLGQHNSGLAG